MGPEGFFLIGGTLLVLALVRYIYSWIITGSCSKCGQPYYYSDAAKVPSSGTSDYKEISWKRNGEKAVEFIRYPLCYEWKCKKCDTITTSWVWSTSFWDWTKPYRNDLSFWHDRLVKADWQQHGESFDVIDCPICSATGGSNVTIDGRLDTQVGLSNGLDLVYQREHYGSSMCGFCCGRGCIKPEKLESLQRK